MIRHGHQTLWRLAKSYLLECLVVDEARRIFGNIKLSLLNVLAELPG
jgi:hypothetical protein